MKRITLALLATAAALAASSAHAETRVSIGVNVGGRPDYRPAPPAVVYVPAPPAVVYAPAPSRGYYQDVTVKTWVPERWVSKHDRRGHHVRVCEPGYFTYHTDRVWVDGRSGHDSHGNRGYAYGHSAHDRDNRNNHHSSHSSHRDSRGGWNR